MSTETRKNVVIVRFPENLFLCRILLQDKVQDKALLAEVDQAISTMYQDPERAVMAFMRAVASLAEHYEDLD